jgi:Putative beta-barrel porin-2, OmpL-like. bbp2
MFEEGPMAARSFKRRIFGAVSGVFAVGAQMVVLPPGAAAQQPAPPTPPPASPMANPTMTGPLSANPHPTKFDAGPIGPVYVTGVLSGLAIGQTDPTAADRDGHFDISNGQVIVQKPDGPFQFYLQSGIYSLPAIGYPYLRAAPTNSDFYGPLPVAWGKWQPTDAFSIQAGKLPTLIGAEYTFTFENMNIDHGLLWSQEPAISRGVQANYSTGPLSFSASFNDGYYSDRFNWLVGSAAWTIDQTQTLSVVGGGNVGSSSSANAFIPLFQNNGQMVNLIYTYANAPWTITPYFQFGNVDRHLSLGIPTGSQTYGGAVLASYKFTDNWSLTGRAEVIGSSGGLNLLGFGPGSWAWSLTATPTWQSGIFFVRGEASLVNVNDIAPGFAFGKGGNIHTQARFALETGVVF